MADWIPIFVLPNILFKDPVENEYVAVVCPDDRRCAQIAEAHPNFMPFLAAFTDAFKRSVVPSVLLVKAGAPPWVMSMDAIGGFRDAISMSTVTHNRSLTIVHGQAKPHQYSTFFDFYAWAFSKSFDVLTTNNPALWGMEQFEDFAGQSTPGISVSKWDRLDYDEPLLGALLGEWPRRFSTSPPPWRSLALFRSLNMAHAAAQIPAVVDVTSQSLGRSISLWVSAFEILAHPGDKLLRSDEAILQL